MTVLTLHTSIVCLFHCLPFFFYKSVYNTVLMSLLHFSTTGLYSGPAHYDVSIRQAAIEAFVKSSFKIFLTQTFPRRGATCYIFPSRAMSQLFNGVTMEHFADICEFLLESETSTIYSGRYFLHWQFGVLCFRPFIR